MNNKKNIGFNNEFQELLFNFAVNVILPCRELPKWNDYNIISYQLIKSASSAGANYEEAQGAVYRADFANKWGLHLKKCANLITG